MGDEAIDTSGLNCPLPVLRARKALQRLSDGERLTVIATDPASQNDFPAFCDAAGHRLEACDAVDGQYTFVIVKHAGGK